MGLRTGLIGIGLGASFIAGGALAYRGGLHEGRIADREAACALPQYAGKAACQNIITTPDVIINDNRATNTLKIAGAIAVLGGVVGIYYSFQEISDTEHRQEPVGDDDKPSASADEA